MYVRALAFRLGLSSRSVKRTAYLDQDQTMPDMNNETFSGNRHRMGTEQHGNKFYVLKMQYSSTTDKLPTKFICQIDSMCFHFVCVYVCGQCVCGGDSNRGARPELCETVLSALQQNACVNHQRVTQNS